MKAIVAASAPYMKDSARRTLISRLEQESRDIMETTFQENTEQGLKRLKEIFGQS